MLSIAPSTRNQEFEDGFVWRSEDNHTIIRGQFWANAESNHKVRFRIDTIEVFGIIIHLGGGPDSFLELANIGSEKACLAIDEATLLDLVGTLSNRYDIGEAKVDEKWWW